MKEKIIKTKVQNFNNIEDYIETNQNKSLLRFITCGSVDDGKSTLIGRLLYDSKIIFKDQLQQLKTDSKKSNSKIKNLDFSLLVDGLSAEREQGITIDVAYRFFATEKCKFIVADTPGHEQYTRNMITGASNAELSIVLVDARNGVSQQTKRHTYLCHLLGIKNFILAVNKMDLTNYDETKFNIIVKDFKKYTQNIGIKNFIAVPISGLVGDNIVKKSDNMKWYNGPTLIHQLENVKLLKSEDEFNDFFMPVQWVNRPNQNFRGFSGKVECGNVKPGDIVRILPSNKTSQVHSIVTYDGNLDQAKKNQSITLTLKDEIDCSRGQIITNKNSDIELSDQFESTIIWMNEKSMVFGRSYYLKIGTQTVSVFVSKPKYKINVNSMEKEAALSLDLNDICVVNITTDQFIPFLSYKQNHTLGGFILIDKMTNVTVGAGLINHALRRSQNIHWQKMDINRFHHAKLKNQKPVVIWMTGLSGSGKSTIANALERRLAEMNKHTFLLDGDNIRHGLNKDLGFTDKDRVENLRRVGQVARLMNDAGLIVIAAFISPFELERDMVRQMICKDEFFEVFIDAPLSVVEKRDVKGLYAKARLGKLKNFTGIDSAYEVPKNPDIHIKTSNISIEEAVDEIMKKIINSIDF